GAEPRIGAGGVAAAREERQRREDGLARGGARGRALLRVDRRAGQDAGRGVLAPAVHAADAPQQMVEDQLRGGGGADPRREDEAGGAGGGGGGEGGRPLGRGLRATQQDRGPGGPRRGAGEEPQGGRVLQ